MPRDNITAARSPAASDVSAKVIPLHRGGVRPIPADDWQDERPNLYASFRSHERIRSDRSDCRFLGYGILFALVAVVLAIGGVW
jgi:hypothetical protein